MYSPSGGDFISSRN